MKIRRYLKCRGGGVLSDWRNRKLILNGHLKMEVRVLGIGVYDP